MRNECLRKVLQDAESFHANTQDFCEDLSVLDRFEQDRAKTLGAIDHFTQKANETAAGLTSRNLTADDLSRLRELEAERENLTSKLLIIDQRVIEKLEKWKNHTQDEVRAIAKNRSRISKFRSTESNNVRGEEIDWTL